MQALKALTAKRAEEVKAVAGAGQATLSKAALEEARLKHIRAEEAQEQAVKVGGLCIILLLLMCCEVSGVADAGVRCEHLPVQEKKRKAAEPDQMHVEVNMSRQGSGQVSPWPVPCSATGPS